MTVLSLTLLSVLLASPPPDWQVLPAPESRSIERIAWSADGARVGVCGEDTVSLLRAPVRQTTIARHGCSDITFDGADVVYAVRHDPEFKGVWRSGPTLAAPKRLTQTTPFAVMARADRLWIAGTDLAVFKADAVVARAPIAGVRRLVSTPAGVLAVTARDVKVVTDTLQVQRTLTPSPPIEGNGLYDAVALPGGRVAAIANGGSVWIWDASGAVVAHGHKIGNANWGVWTGEALVVGQMWLQIDPLRPVARAVHQPRSVGPAALSPDGKRIAIPLHQGVLMRGVTQATALPRGMPATARGIVVTDDAVWVADDYGQLVHFDRQATVRAVHPIAATRLRGLTGDPGKTLYAGTEWGDVVAWRPQGPQRRWPSRSTERVVLSPDGETLYAGGQKTADRFDTRTGARTAMTQADDDYQPFHPTLTPQGEVIWFRGGHPAIWHPKGKPAAPILSGGSGGFDVRGRLWVSDRARKPGIYAWPNLSKIKQLPWIAEGVFVPLADGGMVVTGWGGQVQSFGPEGQERWSKHAPWHVGGVALLTDAKAGDRLLTGGPDLTLSAWDLKTGARTSWAPPGRGQPVSGMAFSADGRLLAVGADSTGLRVWDVKTHRMVRDLAVKAGDVHVNRAGAEWLVHRHDTAYRWPVRGGKARVVKLGEMYDSYLRQARSRGAFVLREGEGQAHVVDLRTGKSVWSLRLPEGVRGAALSPDGQRVAMLVPGELMTLRVQSRGRPAGEGIKGAFRDVAWHGETLIVWQDDGAREWTLKGLRARPDLPAFSAHIESAGARLALGDGKVVRVQDGAQVVRMLPVELYGDAHVRLSPDGSLLAIGGNFTGSVVLWSVQTGAAIARYEAFADGVWRSTTLDGKVRAGKTIPAVK